MPNVLITSRSDELSIALASVLPSCRSIEFDKSAEVGNIVRRLGTGIEVVVHLHSYFDLPTLKSMLRAAADADVEHFVFGSSTCVYGSWRDNPVPLTEVAPLRPNANFARAIRFAEGERLVAGYADEMNVSILRFASVVGGGVVGGGVVGNLRRPALDLALSGLSRRPNSTRPIQLLHIDDATSALQLVIDEGVFGTYNVAPADFVAGAKVRAIAGSMSMPDVSKRVVHSVRSRSQMRHGSTSVSTSNHLEHPCVVSSESLRSRGWTPGFTSAETVATYARPNLWNRLRPQQRRDLVNVSVVSALVTAVGSLVGGAAMVVARRRKKP